MDIVISLIISIVASVMAYYICKWLDRKQPEQSAQIKPPVVAATGGFVLPLNNHFPNDILQPHYSIYQIRLQYS